MSFTHKNKIHDNIKTHAIHINKKQFTQTNWTNPNSRQQKSSLTPLQNPIHHNISGLSLLFIDQNVRQSPMPLVWKNLKEFVQILEELYIVQYCSCCSMLKKKKKLNFFLAVMELNTFCLPTCFWVAFPRSCLSVLLWISSSSTFSSSPFDRTVS